MFFYILTLPALQAGNTQCGCQVKTFDCCTHPPKTFCRIAAFEDNHHL